MYIRETFGLQSRGTGAVKVWAWLHSLYWKWNWVVVTAYGIIYIRSRVFMCTLRLYTNVLLFVLVCVFYFALKIVENSHTLTNCFFKEWRLSSNAKLGYAVCRFISWCQMPFILWWQTLASDKLTLWGFRSSGIRCRVFGVWFPAFHLNTQFLRD